MTSSSSFFDARSRGLRAVYEEEDEGEDEMNTGEDANHQLMLERKAYR